MVRESKIDWITWAGITKQIMEREREGNQMTLREKLGTLEREKKALENKMILIQAEMEKQKEEMFVRLEKYGWQVERYEIGFIILSKEFKEEKDIKIVLATISVKGTIELNAPVKKEDKAFGNYRYAKTILTIDDIKAFEQCIKTLKEITNV